ncbi:MAG TPA: pyridoxamine 5'-phosphate oxidase family protein [Desulfosarcina sp.]|nr:pyridoxamine 5'-phosphate oxidase family protein [Desulfosarcina sp.]
MDANLGDYFRNARGRGILATADRHGRVDAAVYARPKIIDEDTAAFIMRDRLTHANLQTNPHATYLFMEKGSGGYKGKRLFLTKLAEERDSERLYALRRKDHNAIEETPEQRGPLFLTFFKIDKVLPVTMAREGRARDS